MHGADNNWFSFTCKEHDISCIAGRNNTFLFKYLTDKLNTLQSGEASPLISKEYPNHFQKQYFRFLQDVEKLWH